MSNKIFLFLLLVLVVPFILAGCDKLNCEEQNKICIFENNIYSCVDYCSTDNRIIAIVGNCSFNYEYCNPLTKELEPGKCNICGCSSNSKCSDDGNCYKVCSDGTEIGECSNVHLGNFCTNDLNLIFNCTACGDHCSSGTTCKNDGKCWNLETWRETLLEDFEKGNLKTSNDMISPFVGKTLPYYLSYPNLAMEGPVETRPFRGTPIYSSLYTDNEKVLSYSPDARGINDGLLFNKSSEWISNSSYNQFIGIETWFLTPIEFNKISFIQTIPVIQSYKVQIRNSTNGWEDVTPLILLPYYPKDITGPFDEVLNSQNKKDEVIFKKATSDAVRIFISSCSGLCRITEFEIYNTDTSIGAYDYCGAEYTSREYQTNALKEEIYYDKIYFSVSTNDNYREIASLPKNLVRFQIRTAPNNNGKPGVWTNWVGPDCTTDSYYNISGTKICSLHDGDSFVRYKYFSPLNLQMNKYVTPFNRDKYSFFLDEVNITYSALINKPPIVNLILNPSKALIDEKINFTAIAYDQEGEIVSYEWNFGDEDEISSLENSVIHTYEKKGIYSVDVAVIDDEGAKRTISKKIYISDYDCLDGQPIDAVYEPRVSSINDIKDPNDLSKTSEEVKEGLRNDILFYYANKKGISLSDINTADEYSEAVALYLANFMSFHVPSSSDSLNCDTTKYPVENFINPSVKLLIESGADKECNRCNNLFCGWGTDYSLMFTALMRLLGVNANCVYESYSSERPPNCAEKICGSDGYGGVCGVCSDGLACLEGQCVQVKNCIGPDGAIINHLQGKIYFGEPTSQTCERSCLNSPCCNYEIRYCNNGDLSGSFTKTTCSETDWCPDNYICSMSSVSNGRMSSRCEAIWTRDDHCKEDICKSKIAQPNGRNYVWSWFPPRAKQTNYDFCTNDYYYGSWCYA